MSVLSLLPLGFHSSPPSLAVGCGRSQGCTWALRQPYNLIIISPLYSPPAILSSPMKTIEFKAVFQISRLSRNSLSPSASEVGSSRISWSVC